MCEYDKRRKRVDKKDVQSKGVKLKESSQEEGQGRCLCVFEMSLHNRARS